MISKTGLKAVVNSVIEESIQSSNHIKKLTDCITVVATEARKLVELMTLINDRLNDHEAVILQLADLQKQKKDSLEFDVIKNIKSNQSKPN